MKKLILVTLLLVGTSCTTNKALRKAQTDDWSPTSLAQATNMNLGSIR
jgi:hypothetical protein